MARKKTPKQLNSHIRFLKAQVVTAERALKKLEASKKKKPVKRKARRKPAKRKAVRRKRRR